MVVYQAYRYELSPNNRQRTLLAQHAGTACYAYNWGLARRIERFETRKGAERFTDAIEQHREWNRWKREYAPWASASSKCAPQEALRDLDRAFKNFFEGRKKGVPVGFPRFRRRGLNDRFRLTGAISCNGKAVRLPRLGWIRTKGETDLKGQVLSATVSREADRWYVSLAVERERPAPSPIEGPAVGLDVGLSAFVTLSDGTKIDAPRPLARHLRRLRRLSRQHHQRLRGSNNRRKSAMRLARLYRRIKNIRLDFIHKTSSALAKTRSGLVIEHLNVHSMTRDRRFSRAITDVAWAEFRNMLSYKTRWYGSRLIVADRFYPSSKRCSKCSMTYPAFRVGQRVFHCPACGYTANRDLNAAANLARLATGSSPESDACEDPSVGGTALAGLRDTGR